MIATVLKCVIIDDEPAAHYVLCNHIEKSNVLVLVKQCYNALEAHNYLRENEVDIIFLDINMPEISGLDLLQLLKNPPNTILTTAHTEYALESYDYGVVDYLLKPISFTRFLKAIERMIALKKLPALNEPKLLNIKADGKNFEIPFQNISYIQSYGNYVKIITNARNFVVAMPTQEIMNLLPNSKFMRIHKSYIISLEKIKDITNNNVYLENIHLPIGITYKRLLLDRIKAE